MSLLPAANCSTALGKKLEVSISVSLNFHCNIFFLQLVLSAAIYKGMSQTPPDGAAWSFIHTPAADS